MVLHIVNDRICYIASQFNSALYKYHVLGEQEGVPDPGFTPYYNKEFFNTIQKVHDKSPLNPVQMTWDNGTSTCWKTG